MLPEEAGPVRETDWAPAALSVNGDTQVDVPGNAESTANPTMQGLMEEYAQHIVVEDVKAYEKGLDEGLPNNYGKMIIEEWQDGLKNSPYKSSGSLKAATNRPLKRRSSSTNRDTPGNLHEK